MVALIEKVPQVLPDVRPVVPPRSSRLASTKSLHRVKRGRYATLLRVRDWDSAIKIRCARAKLAADRLKTVFKKPKQPQQDYLHHQLLVLRGQWAE